MFSTLYLTLSALATLAPLAAAVPTPIVPDGARLLTRAEASRINWRGAAGTDQNKLGTCGGPINGHQDGDKIQLVTSDHKYCDIKWVFNGQYIGNPYTTANVTSPRMCIDATLYPGNGVEPHMWECLDGVWQQNWVYHNDGRIELAGRGLCLDVRDGIATNNIQLWECIPSNINQQFDIGPYPGDFGQVPAASAPVAGGPVPSAPVASGPVAGEPVVSAPVAGEPVTSAPVGSGPVASAPVVSGPVSSAPAENAPPATDAAVSAPVASAPVASAPAVSASPADAPAADAPAAADTPDVQAAAAYAIY